jgi:hypothetical protein
MEARYRALVEPTSAFYGRQSAATYGGTGASSDIKPKTRLEGARL